MGFSLTINYFDRDKVWYWFKAERIGLHD